MRICIIAEGCYPYVVGGVSSWIHSIIRSFPQYEFIVLALRAERSQNTEFAYALPDNVSEVHEVYLNDLDWSGRREKRRVKRMAKREFGELRSLIFGQETDWHTLFDMFASERYSIDELLMGQDFYQAVLDYYNIKYPQIVFSDFLWTMRSIYMPLFFVMSSHIPKADLYHCTCTGYAGVLGSMGKHFYDARLIISEHGIYTREREEEIVKADWVKDIYKNIWMDQFRKLSRLGYEQADYVTCLYAHARGLQIEIGCPPAKIHITPNGINMKRFEHLAPKTEDDEGVINIGAVVRVTPIKDIKTLIQAFVYAKRSEPSLKLWIMGPVDEDKGYAGECFEMVESYHAKDIVFTGKVDVTEYLGRMDITILTSISEGQPLTVLESFAARCPVIATNVGNCSGLINGEDDDFGDAGIVTHIMNVEEIANAILLLARNPYAREKMGEAGYKRVAEKYRIENMVDTYGRIYSDFDSSILRTRERKWNWWQE